MFKTILILSYLTLIYASITNRFHEWVNEHNIILTDYDHTFNSWYDNDKYIEQHNAKNLSYTLGHNKYSGLNITEFRQLMTSPFKQNDNNLRGNFALLKYPMDNYETLDLSVPSSIDWRTLGAVTPVKDQGQCGSCWSFSVTGAMEGAYKIKTNNLVSFSEQELVDCSLIKYGGPNMGCNGGNMEPTFDWIGKNGGICSGSSYPYISGTTKTAGTCQHTCSLVSGSKVTSSIAVKPKSDIDMINALSQHPVSIAIEADQREFQLYSSGIFNSLNCGQNLDHGVLLVGYSPDYYIMKNSWGTSWGESGYMKMARGSQYNNGAGQCGLLLEGSFPKL